jgi:ankyrin repeat protein
MDFNELSVPYNTYINTLITLIKLNNINLLKVFIMYRPPEYKLLSIKLILVAIQYDTYAICKMLLKTNIIKDAPSGSKFYDNPIFYAIYLANTYPTLGYEKYITLLINSGVNLHTINSDGQTPYEYINNKNIICPVNHFFL